MREYKGFTLIELILVIVVSSVLMVVVAPVLKNPFQIYIEISERAKVVDAADLALRKMARDITRALPNSVRVSGSAIEFLNVAGGGRYRDKPDTLAASDALDFSSADNSFDVLGDVVAPPSGSRLAIFNLGLGGATPVDGYNAYAGVSASSPPAIGSNVITPIGTSISVNSATDTVSLSSAFQFSFSSPQKRFYFVDEPVSYYCDLSTNSIKRYWGYSIQASQPVNPASAPLSAASNALLIDNVSACTFNYQVGSAQRSGLVSLALSLNINGNQVRLMRQVHVSNSP